MASLCGGSIAEDGGQQISEHFDAERQVVQSQTALCGVMSNNNFSHRLADRCMDSLQGVAEVRRKTRNWLEKRTRGGHDRTSAPFSTRLERPPTTDASLYDRAGQCCFLYLEKGHDQVAIPVPCLRPVQARQVRCTTQRLGSPTRKTVYHAIGAKERVRESDAAIFERLKWACFEHQGAWKWWVPFYGITQVREVIFCFIGVAESDGTLPTCVAPLDIAKIKAEVEEVIATESDSIDAEFGDFCTGDGWHSARCEDMMGYQSMPCISEQVDAARLRQKRLMMLHLLTKCARNPSKANGLRVLEGMAMDSCIYEVEGPNRVVAPVRHQPYDRTDELRGLHFTLGWQTDRLCRDLPRNAAWSYLGIVVIWLGVLVWVQPAGDWSTAMAFGQLIAACISPLVLYTRE